LSILHKVCYGKRSVFMKPPWFLRITDKNMEDRGSRNIMDYPDEYYMQRALNLARKGEGRVSPNPMVGAVIVRGDRIIGEGYHERFGGNHAEVNAIEGAAEPLKGATFYVTLEPCAHFGKTPPCVQRIIEAGPARVAIGTKDPNPLVSGRGIKKLRARGIETTVGVLEDSCRALNEKFFHFIRTGRPCVTLKFAQSVDGRIATATGHSQWISSQPSLRLAHRERALHDAVLVGLGTVLKDDPQLTVRLVRGRNPVRIIVDTDLRIPLKARVLQDQEKAKTVVATAAARGADKKREALEKRGIDVMTVGRDRSGNVNLKRLLDELGKREISSLLVEGGATVITSFLREGLANRMLVVIAPKIIGKGIEAVGDLGILKIDQALRMTCRKVMRTGDDIVIDARFSQ
jgi:diaminohydroxyphosphoribosylaminopyrimidine deaminase/5-amino-6-(5-phosphoribosylamino)uracil reductase